MRFKRRFLYDQAPMLCPVGPWHVWTGRTHLLRGTNQNLVRGASHAHQAAPLKTTDFGELVG